MKTDLNKMKTAWKMEHYTKEMWLHMIKNLKKERGLYTEAACQEMLIILRKHRDMAKLLIIELRNGSPTKDVVDQLKHTLDELININEKIGFLEAEMVHIFNKQVHEKYLHYEFWNIANGKRA